MGIRVEDEGPVLLILICGGVSCKSKKSCSLLPQAIGSYFLQGFECFAVLQNDGQLQTCRTALCIRLAITNSSAAWLCKVSFSCWMDLRKGPGWDNLSMPALWRRVHIQAKLGLTWAVYIVGLRRAVHGREPFLWRWAKKKSLDVTIAFNQKITYSYYRFVARAMTKIRQGAPSLALDYSLSLLFAESSNSCQVLPGFVWA